MERVRVEEVKYRKDGSEAKKPHVFYICELCGAKAKGARSASYPQIHVDHIDPVIPVDRKITWEEYVERLFCDVNNLQAICDVCHKEKTTGENAERRRNLKKHT